MFLNFGDLGQNAKEYVEQFASKRAGTSEMNSIADMKRFVEEYPEFRRLSSNVTKHITLVGELSRRVATDHLLEVSELEQSLACNDTHSSDLKSLQTLLQDPAIPAPNKLRLVAIYALRYQKAPSSNLPLLLDLLQSTTPLSPADLALVSHLLAFHSSLLPDSSSSLPPLFQSTSFLSDARSRLSRGLRGVENVYTQHTPRLEAVLQDLIRGRLRESAFPFLEDGGASRDKPQDMVVFVVGGATYEEARMVARVNSAVGKTGVRVVLAGTGTAGSEAFMAEVEGAVKEWGVREGTAEGRLRGVVGR